jgi:plasmid rolling circle replication initiator protein Rep
MKQREQTDKASYSNHLHTLFLSQEIMQKAKINWTTNKQQCETSRKHQVHRQLKIKIRDCKGERRREEREGEG